MVLDRSMSIFPFLIQSHYCLKFVIMNPEMGMIWKVKCVIIDILISTAKTKGTCKC